MADATKQPETLSLGIVYIRGLVKARRKAKRGGVEGVATVLALAAADAYSMPGAVEVWSTKPIGAPGEEASVKCRVSGYPRSYEKRVEDDDGDGYATTRKVTVQTADNTLTVIEA